MRPTVNFVASAFLILLLSCSAIAQNVTGIWKGQLTPPVGKAHMSAQEREIADATNKIIKSIRLTLTLRKDKTFKIVTKQPDPRTKERVVEGTWKQSGSTLTLTPTKGGSLPNKPQVVAVVKGGKSLFWKADNKAMANANFVR